MTVPSARWGHVAAGIEGRVYVWGGLRGYDKLSHDGPDKTEIIFSVDILDVKVSRTGALTVSSSPVHEFDVVTCQYETTLAVHGL